MFQRPQFTFSELDFQLDIGRSCRSRLGSESEEYFSDDSPGCWSNSLEEFKFNGRDCDFDCQQSAAGQPPTSPVPQIQQLLQPPCPISVLDSLSEVAATKNKLMQILQRQQQEQGQGERGRFQQGRAFRALGLDSGCRGMPTQAQVCVFCRNNQETPAVYSSHRLKDDIGQVVCPVLYAYTCPICGANGPMAHTIKYCPLNISGEIESGVINQLKSLRKSVGARRR